MRRLAWAFTGHLCGKYHNLVSWLIWCLLKAYYSWILHKNIHVDIHQNRLPELSNEYLQLMFYGGKWKIIPISSSNRVIHIWATSRQNQLRSAWASAQSDQSLLCTQWVAKDPSFLHADSEDSDQTERMPRLIWIFAGWLCHFVGFVMRRLISVSL